MVTHLFRSTYTKIEWAKFLLTLMPCILSLLQIHSTDSHTCITNAVKYYKNTTQVANELFILKSNDFIFLRYKLSCVLCLILWFQIPQLTQKRNNNATYWAMYIKIWFTPVYIQSKQNKFEISRICFGNSANTKFVARKQIFFKMVNLCSKHPKTCKNLSKVESFRKSNTFYACVWECKMWMNFLSACLSFCLIPEILNGNLPSSYLVPFAIVLKHAIQHTKINLFGTMPVIQIIIYKIKSKC